MKITKAIILNDDFLKQPDEIVFRSFSEVIQRVGKKDTLPEVRKLRTYLNI